MKATVLIAATASLVLLFAAGCTAVGAGTSDGAVPAKQEIAVTVDEFGPEQHIEKEVEVGKGGTVVVTLVSNGTTGFSWDEKAAIADTGIVKQLDHKVIGPDSDKLGAPGQEQWTFEAVGAGTTTVHMDYSRPWEGGEKGVWTFDLTVTAK